jgi:hypothetical protein
MADRDRRDDETSWPRQLLIGIGALVAVALVIGGVVSVVALGAARVAGIAEGPVTASAKPSLYIPSGKPTVKVEPYPAAPGSAGGHASQKAGPAAGTSKKPSAKPKKKPRRISLQASPLHVSAGQRINLTGVYKGGEGTRLQIQRREGGSWADFPVTVPVSGGSFHTYITTSHTGVNALRVLDKGSGRASNVVRVHVG